MDASILNTRQRRNASIGSAGSWRGPQRVPTQPNQRTNNQGSQQNHPQSGANQCWKRHNNLNPPRRRIQSLITWQTSGAVFSTGLVHDALLGYDNIRKLAE